MTTISSLPAYPSPAALESLSPSQNVQIISTISASLSAILLNPKPTYPSIKPFVTSYCTYQAQSTLTQLIWPETHQTSSQTDRKIKKNVISLASKVKKQLDILTVLDLCIIYSNRQYALPVLESLLGSFSRNDTAELLDAFRSRLALAVEDGLYALRKVSYSILSVLRCAPQSLRLAFSKDVMLIGIIARTYDQALASIANSYGGLRLDDEAEDWSKIWVATKVDMVDALHIMYSAAKEDQIEQAFSILFALHEEIASNGSTSFLDRSLLADYELSYSLLSQLPAEDPRVELLRASTATDQKSPGALKLLLRSSGGPVTSSKGKGRAAETPPLDPVEDQIDSVLAILADQPRPYVRYLLTSTDLQGVEAVVNSLLEGTAPPPPDLLTENMAELAVSERLNVFDDDEMNLDKLKVKDKSDVPSQVAQDRQYMEQMKADILRRAEQMSDEEEDEVDHGAHEDDVLQEDAHISLNGDGEGSDSDETDRGGEETVKDVTLLVEDAYLRDPKLFERDSATRRSAERKSLREATGWGDEQLEGWRIMLERDPKAKEKMIERHSFVDNHAIAPPSNTASRGGRGRGRGRGRGGSTQSGHTTQDKASKDRYKASRGNHNRKRGHDKKMARAGGPSA